jgi:RNA polymerase sigma-70 factor (ECF subfamily)
MSAYRQKFLAFRVYRFKDTDAYGELYDIHADRIRRFLVFKVPRKEDAEEITSEVFLRGWEYMTSSAVENVGALLFRIARNITADFYRKNSPVETVEDAVLEQVPADGSLAEQVTQKGESDDLIEKMKLLKDEHREVLVMRYLNEMSIGEIASTLEQTPNNVRVTLHRAKKALQELCVEPSSTTEEFEK